LTIIHSKNYSFRKKWELFIQKIIQLRKNYSTKYSFKKFENYSFKKIIHFFEKLIIAQGYGSGTGAVGLSAAALGATPVLLTDLPSLKELIDHNISVNSSVISTEQCTMAPLVWGDDQQGKAALQVIGGQPDFILVSDCVFYAESVLPLVESLTQLAGPNTDLLLSYEERQSQQKLDTMIQFFQTMREHFTWTKLPLESHHPQFRSEDIQIFKFQTKKVVEIEL